MNLYALAPARGRATLQTLTSNGVNIPGSLLQEASDSTALIGDPAALGARLERDGYLLLRGVLDPARLRALRASYFARFPAGYLEAGTDPADGIFSGRRPPGLPAHGTAGHPAHAFVRTAEFAGFCADPVLERLAASVLGGPVVQLPRRILRHFDCALPAASRAHTDYTYLDAGTDRLLTAWIPVGDCPPALGGLVYLAGSAGLDPRTLDALRSRTDRPGDPRPISHDLEWVAASLGRKWLYAYYRSGDVMLHSPHVVHASLDNTSRRMRLSVDLRYARAGDLLDPRWSDAWAGDDGR